ncbi:hypothetical protein N1031_07045 [Herbiconiux moechotypicola]|uniref:Uncharacterized protein n=1 Tax=Herbiconiux moechotypicola TaxID=637393 RepID=A0ABP5QDM8_9MICO|nr:hypothetical protein [Herbiconiux moechotypicola]MCS5729513.1 hypothetical protein [Herbiconiux moechotypicola]
MALRVFGTDPETQPKPRQSFADDVVGRFRSGHTLNRKPVSLNEWRVTTGDPDVAAAIYDLLGGDQPQTWESGGEDNLEVFTASKSVEIIIEGTKALRQRMVWWSSTGKLIQSGDGETLDDGTPDPDAALTFQERKKKGQDGLGPVPQIELFFRLKELPDVGIFKFQTGSWSLAYDLAAEGIEDRLTDLAANGVKVAATLTLEEVSFVAKNGAMAGKTVRYTKPVFEIKGPVI